jgi:hypothetical protein
MVIYTSVCPICHDTMDSRIDKKYNTCNKCRKKLISGDYTLSRNELKNENMNYLNEINSLNDNINTILAIIKNEDEVFLKGNTRKILIKIKLINMPSHSNEYCEVNNMRKKIKELEAKIFINNYIISSKIPEAQIRYRQQQLIEKQKKEIKDRKKNDNINKAISLKEYCRESFNIKKENYNRGNSEDNFVRNYLRDFIYNHFNNQCICCGSMENLTMDHFWLPKNAGGNFFMYHKEFRTYISNVVVLCRSCNSSKSDCDYKEFFTLSQLEQISVIQEKLNKIINNREMIGNIKVEKNKERVLFP